MNKSWIAIATLLTFIAVSFAFNFSTAETKAVTPVKWYSLEEAVALQKKKPKKIFIVLSLMQNKRTQLHFKEKPLILLHQDQEVIMN